MAFEPGNLVQLKSGGPIMTVSSIDARGDVWCQWFNDKDEPKSQAFKAAVLKLYEEEGPLDIPVED